MVVAARIYLILCLSIALVSWAAYRHFQQDSIGIVLYATDRQYLCNALINLSRLRTLQTKAELVLLLPAEFLHARTGTPINRLALAVQTLNVQLIPLDLAKAGLRVNDVTYEHSLQKLEILRLQYRKLLYFDSDALILRNPDHLFAQMDADLTLPEAYYADADVSFSSAFMLVKPSPTLYAKSQILVQQRDAHDFDMEIFNKLALDPDITHATLPYRGNLLLTGLFRDHDMYSRGQTWNASKEYAEAMYIHFSDAPIPKPWIDDRGASLAQHGPKCTDGSQNCDEVRIWREIYGTFRDQMRNLCPSPKELDL